MVLASGASINIQKVIIKGRPWMGDGQCISERDEPFIVLVLNRYNRLNIVDRPEAIPIVGVMEQLGLWESRSFMLGQEIHQSPIILGFFKK